jgi:hypothetical protein
MEIKDGKGKNDLTEQKITMNGVYFSGSTCLHL